MQSVANIAFFLFPCKHETDIDIRAFDIIMPELRAGYFRSSCDNSCH